MGTLNIRMATVLFALGALVLSATVATEVRAQAPAVDPAAVQKLKQMTEFLDGLPQFSVRAQSTLEELHVTRAPDRQAPGGRSDHQAAEQDARRPRGRIGGPALLL